jgi:hypothetical protein
MRERGASGTVSLTQRLWLAYAEATPSVSIPYAEPRKLLAEQGIVD